MNEEAKYEKARLRVQDKLDFYCHFTTYVVVCTFLYFIYQNTSPGYDWYIWPAMGWGIGVFFHALNVFFIGENSSLVDSMIKKEMDKMRD